MKANATNVGGSLAETARDTYPGVGFRTPSPPTPLPRSTGGEGSGHYARTTRDGDIGNTLIRLPIAA